jgi:hypothetical protein
MNQYQHGSAVSAEMHEHGNLEPNAPFRGIYYGLLFSALIFVLSTILFLGTARLLNSL